MIFCGKCGTQMDDSLKFCPSCGTPVGAAAGAGSPAGQGQNAFANIANTPDTTGAYTAAEIQGGKGMSILAYLGFLVFIPMFAEKENRFVRYHSNQGLVLFIAEAVYMVAYMILSAILLAISWRLYFLTSIIGLLSIVFLVLAIMGIVNASGGKAKELPVIGKMKILK